MGWRLPSYRPDGHYHCPHSHREAPCWGPVEIRDEDMAEENSYPYYQCEAHADCHTYGWGGYLASPYPEDQQAPISEDDDP